MFLTNTVSILHYMAYDKNMFLQNTLFPFKFCISGYVQLGMLAIYILVCSSRRDAHYVKIVIQLITFCFPNFYEPERFVYTCYLFREHSFYYFFMTITNF